MPQTKPIVSVENVVASASVDQKMDLNEITRTFPDVEYHPDQFPGLVFIYIFHTFLAKEVVLLSVLCLFTKTLSVESLLSIQNFPYN